MTTQTKSPRRKKRPRPTSDRQLKRLAVSKIVPNTYNPNRMSDEEFQQYSEEVRHLGRLPKPTVVRLRDEGKYEIVDGEHGWRAAKEAGLKQIDCEIIKADDFEAMRQCYKRNRGGEDDSLVLGRMFLRMQQERDLSQRELAEEIGVSDGTVRNYLQYPIAAEVRNRYAHEDRSEEIADLSVDQVRKFTRLPEVVANYWLDAGGNLAALEDFGSDRIPIEVVVGEITASGLIDFLKVDFAFREALEYLHSLATWRKRYSKVKGINGYLKPVAAKYLHVDFFTLLPLQRDGDSFKVALSAEQWEKVVEQCCNRYADVQSRYSAIQAAVRIKLREAGVDLLDVVAPEVIEKQRFVAAAPEFIGNADFLSLDDQCYLAFQVRDDRSGLAEKAARQTIKALRGAKKRETVRRVFPVILRSLREDAVGPDDDQLFADVVAALAATPALQSATIGDAPASEVLEERLGELDWPEFHLFAGLVRGDGPERAISRWLACLEDDTDE